MNIKKILILFIAGCTIFTGFAFASIPSSPATQGLNPQVAKLAKQAYFNAKRAGIVKNETLTIVDYSIASTKPRMWVIDMRNDKVLFHTHVSHGIGSGDNYAKRFSNQPGSHMSSLGIFLTDDIYYGNHGQSLNLHGLQHKYNSNALSRRIVVHSAGYVNGTIIKKIGRLGRSYGCLALNKKVASNIIQTIKGGSVIFCYYPDSGWLRDSTTLSL